MIRKTILTLAGLVLAAAAFAQRGDVSDKPGDVQRPPSFPIPPSPALTPAEALLTFKVAPGFRIELVASEPLVEDPVAIAFDPDGSIWAVEMRGWMHDPDGTGVDQPIGRIVRLRDTDGDGRMDRSTVFMDGLVVPRAVQPTRDGVLVGAPPYLWFCRDTDGDGRADEKTVVTDDYMNFPTPLTNVEADPNGLLWSMDNWLYNARYQTRFQYREGKWERQEAAIAGQWGISQDDYGRHYFNTNQDQLRANPLPGYYGARNPHLFRPAGWNAQVAVDQNVWPIRVSPGANRAYRAGVLRPDGTLRIFEAACGPSIYRGGLFPAEFEGNAFVPDPVAHLVKRNIISERQGILSAEHAYGSSEFLASTDERFRPVNTYTGPEGALYVVDLYRGIIEYVHVMSSYLRRQIIERGLSTPLGRGRIYRIVPIEAKQLKTRPLAGLNSAQLVGVLSDPNGWRRDTAQRLLVERGDRSVARELQALARSAPHAVTRLHALWTLEGLGALEEQDVLAALADSADKIRAAGVRLAEPWLRTSLDSALARAVLARAEDPSADVLLQVALSLGEAKSPGREVALSRVVLTGGGHVAAEPHPYFANAVVSGLAGRELEFLERILAEPEIRAPARVGDVLTTLAGTIFREGQIARVDQVFHYIGDGRGNPAWARLALIRGIDGMARKHLPARPANLAALENVTDPEVKAPASRLARAITWPGKEGTQRAVTPLTAEQRARVETGRREYALCATCHLPTGQGMTGLAPSLVDSPRLLGSPEIAIRTVLHGKDEYTDFPPMPAFSNLSDDQIASILTYLRREWGHAASPVDPDAVARVRQEPRKLEGPLTAKELEEKSAP